MASRRQYLSQTELADYADINITDTTEADDRISQAEELIDAWVGPQDQHIPKDFNFRGLVSAVSGDTFTLELLHQNNFQNDYFIYCEVEIIGGSGQGKRYQIIDSTYAGVITVAATPDPALDTTSFYRIYQLGKYPRKKDSMFDAIHTPNRYYKSIPEEIKRATAAQVEYMIAKGDDFFSSDDIFKTSESLGNYSYQKARDGGESGLSQLISPKAKIYLRGFTNSKGTIIV